MLLLPEYDFTLFAGQIHLIDALRKKRIFITGGTGFIGKYLVAALQFFNDQLNAGIDITILSRDPKKFIASHPGFVKPYIHFLRGDVRDFSFPSWYKADMIIHGATEASAKLNEEDPELMLDTIYAGTRHILAFAKQAGASRLLLLSSGAVYGKQPAAVSHVDEDCLVGPDVTTATSAYGEGKRVSELLCSFMSDPKKLEIKIARCFAFVGPYLPLDVHFAIGNFIEDVLKGRPKILIKGDGRPLRSYQYGADLVVWLLTILVKGQHMRPYNVGSDSAVSIEETATCVRDVGVDLMPGTKPEIVIATPSDLGQPPPRYVPSVERAKRELGLKEFTPLNEAVRHTLRWHLSLV